MNWNMYYCPASDSLTQSVLCCPHQADCNNYIRLLEFLGDGRIYACGTYAFDPQCAFVVSVCAFALVCLRVLMFPQLNCLGMLPHPFKHHMTDITLHDKHTKAHTLKGTLIWWKYKCSGRWTDKLYTNWLTFFLLMTIALFSFTLTRYYMQFTCMFGSPHFWKMFILFCYSSFKNISSFTLEKSEDGREKMETGKGKCPFEPSQHYTAVMAGMKHTHVA